jgi:branched-chain amino acid transport system substrate-binding protein
MRARPAWAGPARAAVALVVLLVVLGAGAAPAGGQEEDDPQVVTVGVYIQSISDVDLRTGTFVADFYLWFLWRGGIDPTITYEFTNAIREDLDTRATSVNEQNEPEPELLEDGRLYQIFHVQGRFVQPYDVDDYPIDTQTLTISIEDAYSGLGDLVYEVDEASGLAEELHMTGWEPQPLVGRLSEHLYTTNFGYPGGENSVFSRVDFVVHIDRPGISPLLKTIAPLLLIIFIALASLLIDPEQLETRLTLATPALIAGVFLHFTSAAGLPNEGGFLLLDRIYVLSYLVILLVISTGVYVHRLCAQGRTDYAIQVDRRVFAALVLFFIAGVAALIFFR